MDSMLDKGITSQGCATRGFSKRGLRQWSSPAKEADSGKMLTSKIASKSATSYKGKPDSEMLTSADKGI